MPTRLRQADAALVKAGGRITVMVGTMYVAMVFAVLSCLALPDVVAAHSLVLWVQWITQSFLQLVLLPIIIVGQNLQGKASEARSIRTLEDVEKLLALQTAHIAREHRRTRAHLTALVAENEATS